ncbi:TPA: SIR2 family protein, partial [Pasteurella multocida]|nr:SIR2 family protein [Pasteurella multocida]
MIYQDALIQVKSGNAMLFYGAGMSYDVINIINEKMPTSDKLSDKLDKDAEGDLTLASELYIDKNGTKSLIELLKSNFKTKDMETNPPEYYKIIAAENWRSIFTTNYDDAFETASRKIGKYRESVEPEMTPKDYPINDNSIIHVNGFINTITSEKLNTTFKLTEGSYLADQFIKGNWYNAFMSEVQASKAIIFIGYGLRADFDIKKIFFEFNEHLKGKTFFITLKENKILERYGSVIPIGIQGFAEDLKNLNLDNLPEKSIEILNF